MDLTAKPVSTAQKNLRRIRASPMLSFSAHQVTGPTRISRPEHLPCVPKTRYCLFRAHQNRSKNAFFAGPPVYFAYAQSRTRR
jgi:hypothetical protein